MAVGFPDDGSARGQRIDAASLVRRVSGAAERFIDGSRFIGMDGAGRYPLGHLGGADHLAAIVEDPDQAMVGQPAGLGVQAVDAYDPVVVAVDQDAMVL